MATWRVTATTPGGTDYVYRITGPANADEQEIVCQAYAEHGRKLRAGEVAEALGPWAVVSEITDSGVEAPHVPPLPSNDCT